MQNIIISCIESRQEPNGLLYGRYLFGPVPQGLAATIGSALRRSLLGELSGFAITYAEMLGVSNEYCVVPGARETALDVLLNLKKLVFTSTTKARQKAIGYISVRGPGIVTGHDLKLPPGIQCANPNQVLANLAADGVLQLRCLICLGKSYLIQSGLEPLKDKTLAKKYFNYEQTTHLKDQENQSKPQQRQVFALDAVFMPVMRVNFSVYSNEDMIQSLDIPSRDVTERILFEIWTNGSLTPTKALHEAAVELVRLFSLFTDIKPLQPMQLKNSTRKRKDEFLAEIEEIEKSENALEEPSAVIPHQRETLQVMFHPNHFLEMDLGILPLSPSIYQKLKSLEFERLKDFLGKSYDELLHIPSMTPETLFGILCHLRSYGLQLRPDQEKNDVQSTFSR